MGQNAGRCAFLACPPAHVKKTAILGMTKKPLTRNLRIRLNEDEDRAFVQLAQTVGEKTRSRLIRKMIREAIGQGPDLFHEDLASFRDAVRQLGALGRNLNQIAHALNAGSLNGVALESNLLRAVEHQVTTLKNELKAIVLRTRHRWVHHG